MEKRLSLALQLIVVFTLLLFVACGGEEPPYNGEEPELPDVVIVVEDPTDPPDNGGYIAQISHIPSYFVDLSVYPPQRLVQGVLQVDFVNTAILNLNRVYFSLPLNVDIMAATVNLAPSHFHKFGNILRIYLDDPLMPGESLDIGLVFEAQIVHEALEIGANPHAMWFGNFVPALMVVGDDGWHNYPFFTTISNFLVNISTPPEYFATATAATTSTIGTDLNLSIIDAILVRDFAFAILSNAYNSRQIGNTTLYYREPNLDEEALQAVLTRADEAAAHFNLRIAPNPHNSLKIVEIDLDADMRAYPGIIFVDSAHLRSLQVHQSLTRGIASQWFGNILGTNPVAEPWLACGLAGFLALDYEFSPDWVSREIRRLHAAHNLSLNYIDYNDLYMQHTRGIIFFYVLRYEMGGAAFEEFFTTFYNRFAFEIATSRDLMAVAREFHPDLPDDFLEIWIKTPLIPSLPIRDTDLDPIDTEN
ncbi:MAG: hypothetical protein LBE35_10690 [Clostridiales bacterium]|jgi:hypothetical protein|nr:hypothetical protein [Clostridiales bacterium]